MKTLLFIGCPNSGKTALFNLLSGENRKVANYSGITVDTAIAELKTNKDHEHKVRIVDLPGIYGFLPSSIDEGVTLGTLLGSNVQIPEFDEVVVVVDMGRVEASLALVFAMRELFGDRVIVIINKADMKTGHTFYDWDQFSQLTNLKVIKYSALREDNRRLDAFLRANIHMDKLQYQTKILLSEYALTMIPFPGIESNSQIEICLNELQALNKIERFQKEARAVKAQIVRGDAKARVKLSYLIDKWTLHPFFGGLIFAAIFYLIFHAIYSWSAPFMDLIDGGVQGLGEFIGAYLSNSALKSFLVDGVIAGVGGVIIFLPQIMILFFLLSLLEQSGYVSRAAIITDKLMSFFGLNGRAFLPFMSGFACAVPAIMATRTIYDKRERLATLMVIPLITCSARLPVYVLLIGTFIPQYKVLGLLDSRALAFFFLYFLGSIVALIMAKIFRLTFFKGKSSSFLMELPLYQRPSFKVASFAMFFKGRIFLKKAGTVILALSILIWVLSTFPKASPDLVIGKTNAEVASITLEHSALGQIGKTIEPLIEPLGYDWKIGVGILVAFGARELFVSAMGTIYALGDVDEGSNSLRERIKSDINPKTGKPVFSLAVAWSLLIFFAFACQCASTLAIVRKETESRLYPVILFLYMGALAYAGSFVTYRLLL